MTWEYFADPRPDIQALVNAPGSRVLDVGCGQGALGRALKGMGANFVAGVELDAASAAAASDTLDLVVHGSVVDDPLPFNSEDFDYLIFADVLEHTPDPDAVLDRCLPFLKPDGHVVISVPNMRFYTVLLRLLADRWSYADYGIRDRTHLRVFTRHSLIALLRRHGLTVEQLVRHYRLMEDQTEIGRLGALATRLASATIAPALFPELLAYQYVVVARRAG